MKRSIVSVLMLASCAGWSTGERKVYEPERIQAVPAWRVEFSEGFNPEASGDADKANDAPDYKAWALDRRVVYLKNEVFYLLQDKYGVEMTKVAVEGSGAIKLYPLLARSGGFQAITAECVDATGAVLARVKVTAGSDRAKQKHDQSITAHVARELARVLNPGAVSRDSLASD